MSLRLPQISIHVFEEGLCSRQRRPTPSGEISPPRGEVVGRADAAGDLRPLEQGRRERGVLALVHLVTLWLRIGLCNGFGNVIFSSMKNASGNELKLPFSGKGCVKAIGEALFIQPQTYNIR